MSEYNLVLSHHGIKGQKWGIRRFQNKDGSLTAEGKKRIHKDDIVIKKGTVAGHVSPSKRLKLSNSPTYLYDSKNEHDKNVYEGKYADELKFKYGLSKKEKNIQYAHRYEITTDLISPSDERRSDIFVKSFRKNPKAYIKELNAVASNNANEYEDHGPTGEKRLDDLSAWASKVSNRKNSYEIFDEHTSGKDLKKYGYSALNLAGAAGVEKSKALQEYFNAVKNTGYNALIDDNNKESYYKVSEPFIALYGSKSLKELKRSRKKINEQTRQENIKRVKQFYLRNYGFIPAGV